MISQKYILFFILLAFSCSRKQASKTEIVPKYSEPTIEIEGINLSEDGSRLSSNNDELLILIYENKIDSSPTSPLFMTYVILDAEKRKANIEIDNSLIGKDIIFTLVEVDTEKDITDIEALVTQNASKLLEAHQNQDRIKEIEILGDDDLLGMRKISKDNLNSNHSFTIRGVHKIDRFEYRVKIYN